MRDPPERLRKAVIDGNLPITKRLLARFPELWLNTDPTNKGWCNLHYAAFQGNYLVCFHLMSLKRRAFAASDMDMLTFDNLTVLHMPIFRHHSQTLHYLLQEFSGHAWINHKGGDLERTPLHYCCICFFTDGLKLLLEFGADWKLTDKNGDTCLHLCFAYGDKAGLRELVKCIVAKCLRSLHEVGQSSVPAREAILAELMEFEDIRNNHGFKAIDYAASFDLQTLYKENRTSWVEAAIEEESMLLKSRSDNWDSVLAFTPTGGSAKFDISSLHPSSQSSASSLTAPDSSSLAISQATKPSISPEKDESVAKQTRTHSSSLGNDASHFSPSDKAARRRANTSIVQGYKPPPPPLALNTHSNSSGSSKSNVKMSSPVTPLSIDFPKTPSLKSVTISPSVRGSKRRTSINSLTAAATESVKETTPDESSLSASPESNPQISQFASPIVEQHPSTTIPAQLQMESIHAPKINSRRSSLRRNISTPSVIHSSAISNGSSETPSHPHGRGERFYRHANASDSLIRSRPTSPFESGGDETSTSLDTIKLVHQRSHDAVPEDQVVQSFVVTIPRESINGRGGRDERTYSMSSVRSKPDSSRTSTISSQSTGRDLNSIKLTRVRDD
ncbi:hypothetical protein ACQ2H7_001834 [Candidozyma auris]